MTISPCRWLLIALTSASLSYGCGSSQSSSSSPAATSSARLTVAPVTPSPGETVTFRLALARGTPAVIVAVDRARGAIAWRGTLNGPDATASTPLPAGDYLVAAIGEQSRSILATTHLLVGSGAAEPSPPVAVDRITTASGWSISISFIPRPLQAGRTAIGSLSFTSMNGNPVPQSSIEEPGLIAYDESGDHLSVSHRVAERSTTGTGISHVDESPGVISLHGETTLHFDFSHPGAFTIAGIARIGDERVPLRFVMVVQ